MESSLLQSLADSAMVTMQLHAEDALAESVESGQSIGLCGSSMTVATPNSTHGELVVHGCPVL